MAVFVVGVVVAAVMQLLAVGEEINDGEDGVQKVMKIIGVQIDQYDLPDEPEVPDAPEEGDLTLVFREEKEKELMSTSAAASVLLLPVITRRAPADPRLRAAAYRAR